MTTAPDIGHAPRKLKLATVSLAACFGYGARTLGVGFEKAPEGDKTGTAGWYNASTASQMASERGLTYRTINGDAFDPATKAEVLAALDVLRRMRGGSEDTRL